MKIQNPILILTIVLLSLTFLSSGMFIGYTYNNILYNTGYENGYYDGMFSSEDGNYAKMRDIFTPCSSNETVTITNSDFFISEENGRSGYTFWVNHTQICHSYYFNNSISYKVVIPSVGDIYVLETRDTP